MLVADDAASQIPIEIGRDHFRLGARIRVGHEQSGLIVGARRAGHGADERDSPPVRRESKRAHHPVDRDDARDVPARGRHGVERRGRELVVRLEGAVRGEIDARPVLGPHRRALVVRTRGDPLRRDFVAGLGRNVQGPDVTMAIRLGVPFVIDTVGRQGHDPDVAHALRLGLLPVLFLLLLRDVLVGRAAQEREPFAVRRPGGGAGPFREGGEGPGLAAGHGQEVDLRRLGLAILLDRAAEDELFAVGGPARAAVVRSGGQPHRRPSARRDEPDRGLVPFFLCVHLHAHEGDARAVGRNLRVGDPDEAEQVLFGDRPLVGGDRIRHEREQETGQGGKPRGASRHWPLHGRSAMLADPGTNGSGLFASFRTSGNTLR